jgi:hypothetical protein
MQAGTQFPQNRRDFRPPSRCFTCLGRKQLRSTGGVREFQMTRLFPKSRAAPMGQAHRNVCMYTMPNIAPISAPPRADQRGE